MRPGTVARKVMLKMYQVPDSAATPPIYIEGFRDCPQAIASVDILLNSLFRDLNPDIPGPLKGVLWRAR
jgi:hypothetical protein